MVGALGGGWGCVLIWGLEHIPRGQPEDEEGEGGLKMPVPLVRIGIDQEQ